MLLPLELSRDHETTLQAQIFTQVRDHILAGRIRPGDPIPATRSLARQHGISRNTAIQAYERLVSEGYLEARRGGFGTRVSAKLPEARLQIARPTAGKAGEEGERRGSPSAQEGQILSKTAVTFRCRGPELPETGLTRATIDFWPGRPNRRHFPGRVWRKLTIEHLSNAGATMSEYGDPAGALAFREAISNHLRLARGMNIAPERVIVTAGTQEGINIIARLFVTPRTHIVVENPCYQGAALTFESFGASLIPLAVDNDGARVECLQGLRAPLAYVTPSHQFPIGATLTLERRLRLLHWARQVGAYLIEDDYDGDYRYDGPPLVALAGLDPDEENVIYLGTLSKSLGAGLRTGFMVVPEALINPARVVKTLLNYGHPWLEQIVAADFLASGHYQRHLRRIVRSCQNTRDCLLHALTEKFGSGLRISGTECGMHVMWRLPDGFPAPDALMAATRRHGVRVHTVASAGAVDFGSDSARDGLVLGYAALTETEIRTGVTAIALALDDLTAKPAGSRIGGRLAGLTARL